MGLRAGIMVFALAIAGVLVSVYVSSGLRSAEDATARAQLNFIMEERILSLEKQLAFNLEVLYSLQRHVKRSPNMTLDEFQSIAADIMLRHPNIQALEWIPRVKAADREMFEQSRRADYPDFRIRDRAPTGEMLPAAPRDEYFPVGYVEPYEGNEKAVGYDLASDDTRRASLYASADSGLPKISGVIQLVQDTEPVNAFLGFFPIYEDTPTTPSERRETLKGFVLGVYRIQEFVDFLLQKQGVEGINMTLLDVTDSQITLLHHHESRSGEVASGKLEYRRELGGFGGRQWLMEARITPTFENQFMTNAPNLILIAGLLITFLLTYYIAYLNLRAQIVNELVTLRTEELLASTEEAEAAGKVKAEFLANMSHEIRTPLNGIVGMTQLLLETRLAPDQEEYLKTIDTSSEHLQSLINDILDFSKIEAGKLEIESIDVDLAALIGEVVDMFSIVVSDKGVDLDTNFDQTIKNYVSSDPSRLRQIILNLTGNALKFTESGAVTIDLRRLRETDSMLVLRVSVSDTGIGIAEEMQGSVFESFSQADLSTTRKFGGTGLGLTICKQLVQALGGAIEVESTLHEGSCFSFTIPFKKSRPLQRDQQAGRSVGSQEMKGLPESPAGGSARILVAEDNIVNQKVMVRFVESLGHTPIVVNNGREAIDLLTNEKIDLVLMDCQMPIMDGYAATKVIRDQDGELSTLPIIAITADALDGTREKCEAAGMNDCLSKPVNKDALSAILKRHLH
ncbi:MAG: CHASE domain-containing protein [Candidatus Hydrogenedentota bacterium]